MMLSMRSRFPVPAVLLAGLAGVLIGPLHAAEPDKSDWECRFCAFPSGTEVDVDGGIIWVSDDAAKFGDFTGLDEAGAYLDAHLAYNTGVRAGIVGNCWGETSA